MSKISGEVLVEEILGSECKNIRNRLLIISTISLAVIKGGLIPQSISTLGISLTLSNVKYLIIILMISCFYFLFSFIQLLISDFIRWRMNFYALIAKIYKEDGVISGEEVLGRPNVPGHNDKIDNFMKIIKYNNIVRFVFQVGIPIVFSIYVIVITILELVK